MRDFILKKIAISKNIGLLNIPPYTAELNPCEQAWKYIKNRFKNQTFDNLESIKNWLHKFVSNMKKETIKKLPNWHHFSSLDCIYYLPNPLELNLPH